jgi:hypothetical protein
MTEAYPLRWPDGWPRTKPSAITDGRSRFVRPGSGYWTFAPARDALITEVWRLPEIKSVVISSNFAPGRDGPSARGPRPVDQAIALYFTRRGKPFVMACDRYSRAEENMRSLALAIEAMRQLERHGGGFMMERAFDGFAVLPPPSEEPWWVVLQVARTATRADIEAAWRKLAAANHPDRGGSDAAMARINTARDRALAERADG